MPVVLDHDFHYNQTIKNFWAQVSWSHTPGTEGEAQERCATLPPKSKQIFQIRIFEWSIH
jgi:hypothetical protein